MMRIILTVALAMVMTLAATSTALAESPVHFGEIWLDGTLVRTLLPPAALTEEGTAPFYMVPGTGGVAGVGPGDAGYRGGAWKVYIVTWTGAMRPLTSQAAIVAAESAGEITVARAAALDFRCPIQP